MKGAILAILTKNNKPSEPASPRHEHLIQVLRASHKVNQLILAEKKPGRLLGEICQLLTETRGYHNAWIALEKNSRPVEPFFHSGFGDKFKPMAERLRANQLPHCAKATLESNNILVITDPPTQCADCPLAKEYVGRASLVARLRHEDHDFGLLCASVPKAAASDRGSSGPYHRVGPQHRPRPLVHQGEYSLSRTDTNAAGSGFRIQH